MQTQQPEKITIGGIDEGSRPQIVTILSELVGSTSLRVINLNNSSFSYMSADDAALYMAKRITNTNIECLKIGSFCQVKATRDNLLISALFHKSHYGLIENTATPANFSTAADLRAALMRAFVSSRNTVFGCAKISAMPSVTQSTLITQIDFIKDLKPKSTTISVVYPSQYSEDTAYVIVKDFSYGNIVHYARYEMSATDLNKALYGSHIYGEITLPETVLDKLISSY